MIIDDLIRIREAQYDAVKAALEAAGYHVFDDGKALRTRHSHDLNSLNVHEIMENLR